jgi:peptidoglycan/LPS O-acetylase OafA/YrhL
MNTKPERTGFRSDIQALRGLAILLVLLFHLPETFLHLGYLGVDIFFVISGYLITPRIFVLFDKTPNLNSLRSNFFRFAKNRFRRLAPAFGITILFFLPILLLIGDVGLQSITVNQSIAGILLLGNVGAYKFGGEYFNPGIENPFLHFWSLSVEEQIYIFLPMFFLILYVMNRKRFNTLAKVFFIIIGLLSLFLTFNDQYLVQLYSNYFAVPQNFSFYSPITRFWEFAVGGLISFFGFNHVKKNISRPARNLLNCFFIVFIVFAPRLEERFITLVVVLITAILIISRSLEAIPRIFNKVFVYLGYRSYSLYLVHLPIIYILVESPYAQRKFGDVTQVVQIVAVLLSIFSSSLIYRFVELRFHQFDSSSETRTTQLKSKWLVILTSFSLALSIIAIPVTKSGFFGVLNTSVVDNPGLDFKNYCIREQSLFQYPCSFPGGGSEGTIALVGDSHASQYSLLLWDLSRARGMKLILVGDFGGEVNSSRTINSVRNLKPDLIIVSKYWQSDLLEKNSNLLKDLNSLQQLSESFLIVGQNPIFVLDESAPSISMLDKLLGYEAPKVISKPFEISTQESRQADDLIRTWAKEIQVDYLDTHKILCPEVYCRKLERGESLYIDSNHLSASGAQILRPDFEDFLDSQGFR